jgi:hypothetical protein
MHRPKNSRVLPKTGGRQLFVFIHLRRVASPFARNYDVSGHLFSLANSMQ